MPLTLFLVMAAAAEPVALEQHGIRIEVDPGVFTLRYLGLADGKNLLDPLFVDDEARRSGAWLDPGGLVTDVLPYTSKDAALRRGPAEVLERTSTTLVLLGPASPERELRLSKRIEILPPQEGAGAGRVRFTVSLLATEGEPRRLAVRNTARIPVPADARRGAAVLRLPGGGAVRPLAGAEALEPYGTQDGKDWAFPVPPAHAAAGLVIGTPARQAGLQGHSTRWTRRLPEPPETAAALPHNAAFLALIDDRTRSYGFAAQSPWATVEPGRPLVFVEEWTFQPLAEP